MAEFKLERFKYTWKGDWVGGTDYLRDDIVKVGGKSYVCLITHTADADFNVDLEATVPGSNPPIPDPRWTVMTDSRAFVGNWATSTIYNKGDIVQFDGTLWTCVDGHTASDFATDYANWEVFAQGIKFRANWQSGTGYGPGALVKYNGIVYKCINPHSAGGSINDNIDDWEIFYDGVEYTGALQADTLYRVNDLIKFGGSIFKVVEEFTSPAAGIDDTKVELVLPGFQFDGDWDESTAYSIGDVVRYGGYMFYCTNNNIGTDPFVRDEDSSNYWAKLALTYNFRGVWSETANYRPGDIVQRGGDLYLAKYEVGGGDENDGSSLDYLDTDVWEKLVPGTVFGKENAVTGLGSTDGSTVLYNVQFSLPRNGDVGNKYVLAGEYRPELKFYEDYTYIFNQNDLDNVYFPNGLAGPANPHPLNFSEDSIDGERGGGTAFLSGVTYYLDDAVVSYDDYATNFAAATTRRVEIRITNQTPRTLYYWCTNHNGMGNVINIDAEPVLSGNWTADREYYVNEVVYYLGTAYKCNTQHLSTTDNFPGDNGSGYYYWDTFIERGSAAGLNDKGDLLTYGLNRTLAGDQSSLGPVALNIGNERELLSVTTDDEVFWRNYIHDSDTIFVGQNGMDADGWGLNPNRPFATVKHACEYVLDNFEPLTPTKIYVATGHYIETGPISIPAGCVIMGDELRATKITANDPLDDYKDDDYIYKKRYIQHFLTFVDDLLQNRLVTVTAGNTVFQDRSVPGVGDLPTASIVELIDFHDEYLDYWLGSGVTEPTIVSTNTATTDVDYTNAIEILDNNRDFIANEVFAYLNNTQTDYTYEEDRIRRDVYHFLKAIEHDLKYTGNYRTILHCRDFKNKALGSQFDDFFYIRDVTGLRNCTITGLRGTLNPPGVYDLYQRPTGGACVSLDPGWGPDDESVWINTRSPYIQGVTNIGSNCVGQKIDGSLHNGGLKSCTSNDFTQVLSDGVGAWVTNGGRVELVSVFTYYCVIGYLADEGGIIRATNGNNSYGVFGAIADGYDPTETPQNVTLDNRSENDATVESVFAGEFTDQIFAMEFNHCGEGYTTATAEIVGSGVNADVEFNDFRDGGLYNVRIINSDGSGSVGGAGYKLRSGNAQTGNATTIQLESDSGFDEVDVINQRIIIVSGDGTGQYGYIYSYDNGTKTATVYKESTDTAGWDHIVPGTAIETLLTTNTQYRIEPRVECEAPPTSTSEANLPQVRPYEDVAYGDTTSIYEDLTFTNGNGDVAAGIGASNAVFNLTRIAQTYTVTITDPGTGYAVGDQTVVLGTVLGGTTGVNDCTITVTEVTDDSSNAIQAVSVTGTGIGGKYVAIADPNFVSYSDTASLWTETNLPFVGTWEKIVNGNNRFIALNTDTSDQFGLSLDGISWSRKTIGPLQDYTDIVYGGGKFVAVAKNSNTTVYSNDGDTWGQGSIPDDLLGDSTASEWLYVTYGSGTYVAVSGNDSSSATSTDGITWSRHTGLPAGSNDWVGLAYGRGRFILLAETGEIYYSFDGVTWTSGGDMPSQDGSTVMHWTKLKYENGLFIALCDTTGLTIGADVSDGTTNYFATSDDGLLWQDRTFPSSKIWGCITHGPEGFIALAQNATLNGVGIVQMGATARLRADVGSNAFDTIKIWDPGSGYDPANPPSITITANPDFTVAVATEQRVGTTGTLASPDWINRGQGYRSSTTTVTINGDGYADNFPAGNEVVVTGVSFVPGPGAQIRFDDILNEETIDPDDLKLFAAVQIEDLGDDGTGNNTRKVKFTISPKVEIADNLSHGSNMEIRINYSQCRVTNHDFLDIGTGNFEETNYPELYAGGNYFVSAPENEVYEENGGRVFYTSSDQDGNFRAGELFSVQQSTGIVTISAEFFNLDGLSELALGGVRLGGSGAVVREFSTDVNFTEDSNNVVPTQRAVITFLANRLSEGGSELETNQLIAGRVLLGGENNLIDHSLGGVVEIPVLAKFEGTGDPLNPTEVTQISGLMQAYPLYFRQANETVQ